MSYLKKMKNENGLIRNR